MQTWQLKASFLRFKKKKITALCQTSLFLGEAKLMGHSSKVEFCHNLELSAQRAKYAS